VRGWPIVLRLYTAMANFMHTDVRHAASDGVPVMSVSGTRGGRRIVVLAQRA